jgi:hypothetical protein
MESANKKGAGEEKTRPKLTKIVIGPI